MQMKQALGIAADSYVMLDERCHIHCEVRHDQLEFRFGGGLNGLHVVMDGGGFQKFMGLAMDVVGRLSEVEGVEWEAFVVGDDDGHEDEQACPG